MRKISLKKVDGLDYKTLLKSILAAPKDQSAGLQLDEIRKAVKILDTIDAADDAVMLEDSDWQYVRDRVKGASYVVADKRIVDFADTVIGAPEVAIQERAVNLTMANTR